MGFCTQCTIGRRENDFYPDTISSDGSGSYEYGVNSGDDWDWWVQHYYEVNGLFFWWTLVYRFEISKANFQSYGIVNTKNWAWGGNDILSTNNSTANSNKAGTMTGKIGAWPGGPGWAPNVSTGTPYNTVFGRQGLVSNQFFSPCNHAYNASTSTFGPYINPSTTKSQGAFSEPNRLYVYSNDTFDRAEVLANEGDEYYYLYWEAFKYKLRTAGPPSILQNTIRFDPDWQTNHSPNNNNYPYNNYRVIFYDSDVFLQNCVTNNQSGSNQRFEGRHGQGLYPLVQKTRYESGNNETMLEADEFRLIVNNTGTVYYKFKRDDYTSTNHRVLLYRNGQGTASIIQNNTNGSEITGSFTLTAGIYTVDFQKFDGSWQQPTVANMRALVTSEEP